MSRTNRKPLAERVTEVAEAALAARNYVAPIDVLLGMGWLDLNTARRWQQGQIEHLEGALQTSPSRRSEAMTLLRSWATERALIPSQTDYVARTPARQALRFSASGDESLEQFYRTHWVSRELPEKKRERLLEKANRAPELVVIQPLNNAWKCHKCGENGDLLVMENPGPACLRCVGLDDLEFLSAGNALLTRRVRAKSPRHAVVVRFSRTRGRYERRGLLVETQALDDAEREIAEKPRKRGD